MKTTPKRKLKPSSTQRHLPARKIKPSKPDTFKSIYQNAIEGIFQSTIGGKLLLANPSFVRMLGYRSITELKQKSLTNIFFNPEDRKKLTEALQKEGRVSNFELTLKRRDGSPVIVNENSRLVKDSEGNILYIEGMIVDITEQKRITERLLTAELKYQGIFNNAVEGIYQSTPQGQLLTVNTAFLNMMGYESVEAIETLDVNQMYANPDARLAFKEIVEREGIITDYELQLRRKDGKIITALVNSRVVRDAAGNTLYYEGMIQDITRRKAQEEQLKVLNAQKDKFLGIVSHDLRAPFNSILGFTDLMMDESNPLSASEQREFIGYINDAAKQQLQLLTNLLDWSRFETGRMRFSFKPIKLSDVVSKCIVALFGNAKKKQITLTADIEPGLTVYADEYLLQQLFANLVSNAIKFTPPGGNVRVGTHGIADHFLTISVSDTGIGISPEDKQKLFRIEAKHTTRGTEGEEGSGLGLVLCAEIVEKHGGTIRVESEPDKGTSFIFTLLLPRKTVLVAEDDKADRLLITRYIEQTYPELTILETANGITALQMATQNYPCVIVADFIMPGMDGIKLIRELRKNPATKGIPVVSITSVQSQGSAADLRAAGAVEVLLKPISKAELKTVLDKFVK